MPTTDTFIIPPMQLEEEPKKEKKKKKKSSGSRTFLFIGLVLLILTLPVAIYYITQQQELADTRSKAASESCTKGTSACQIDAKTGKNSGFACKCTDTAGGYVWSCGISDPGACPVEVATKEIVVGTLPVTRAVADGSAGGCGYIQKPPNSGNKSCNAETCGGSCGVFTYDCGQLCFDGSCGATGCASGGGVGLVESVVEAVVEPTATPVSTIAPTAAPTATPTSAPNSSQCDASCTTDADCASGLTCSSVDGINRCRNASCPTESSCDCPSVADNSEQTTTTAYEETTYEDTTAGEAMPVSGIGPGIIGSITVIGSVLLLLVGLVL